jgi:hypothetical protein
LTVPRPGTDVIIMDGAAPGGAVLNTGQAFLVGSSGRGPTDRAVRITSPNRYEAVYGDRSGGSLLADAVSAYFNEGGAVAYISRAAAADAVAATASFGSLTVDAASPGAWGDGVAVTAEAPTTLAERLRAPRAAGDPIVLVVSYEGTNVERSPVVGSAAECVAWAAEFSDLVRFTVGADNLVPAAGVTADLTGGANGTAITDTQVAAALARFGAGLGPGQVLAPGLTSDAVHDALLAHGDSFTRCPLLDLPDSGDPTVLAASKLAVEGTDGARFSASWAPWLTYPGPAGAEVTVPYSAVQAALIAAADRATGNPNQPAAGVNGVARYATGLSQEFTDEQREALNGEGVNLAKVIYGDVRTYGYRTSTSPDDENWLWFGGSRTVMAVAHEGNAAAENYVLGQIDGRRQVFAKLETDLRGICLRYWNAGALFGETPEDAFQVDTGESVNTIDTIKRGEIHAVIRLKTSPAAEWVVIGIVKVPVDQPLAAIAA